MPTTGPRCLLEQIPAPLRYLYLEPFLDPRTAQRGDPRLADSMRLAEEKVSPSLENVVAGLLAALAGLGLPAVELYKQARIKIGDKISDQVATRFGAIRGVLTVLSAARR